MNIKQALVAVFATAGIGTVFAPHIKDAVDRVNDGYSEQVGGKPNLMTRTFQDWVNNAPDFDETPTVGGFIKKHGASLTPTPPSFKGPGE